MSEKKKHDSKAEGKATEGPDAGANRQPAGKSASGGKGKAEKDTGETAGMPHPEEEIEPGPGDETVERGDETRAGTGEEKLSEEEFRRLVEESLEQVTVADVALTMMNQLASLGYMKMGLPESVNLKYRDPDQASLAIDILEALIKGVEGKMPEDSLRPFRGTLANLQMNFVQIRRS